MIYWAVASLAASLVLGTWAFSFKIDAAPVGGMIFMGALAIAVVSIFLFGVLLGQAIG